MGYYVIKLVLTAAVIVGISELAKRSLFWGAALASLPLTSLLAFVWIYLDTRDTVRIAALSHTIFWLVLPSLVLFLVFPLMLKSGAGFWISLAASSGVTAAAYLGMIRLLALAGVAL